MNLDFDFDGWMSWGWVVGMLDGLCYMKGSEGLEKYALMGSDEPNTVEDVLCKRIILLLLLVRPSSTGNGRL